MTDRVPLDPRLATASRRAAALLMHWRRHDDTLDGEFAVLSELGDDKEQWVALVCALLNLSDHLTEAARTGREDAYLAYVLRESSIDEVSADG